MDRCRRRADLSEPVRSLLSHEFQAMRRLAFARQGVTFLKLWLFVGSQWLVAGRDDAAWPELMVQEVAKPLNGSSGDEEPPENCSELKCGHGEIDEERCICECDKGWKQEGGKAGHSTELASLFLRT